MSKRALEAAMEAYPDKTINGVWLDYSLHRELYQKAYEQAEKDLGLHSVEESLPEIDEEVIVLCDILIENSMSIGLGRIAFGHIVDKNIAVDYNGWNIPGVKFWMPRPKIPNEKCHDTNDM